MKVSNTGQVIYKAEKVCCRSFPDITVKNALIKMNTTHGETSSELESNAGSPQQVHLKNQHGHIRVNKI